MIKEKKNRSPSFHFLELEQIRPEVPVCFCQSTLSTSPSKATIAVKTFCQTTLTESRQHRKKSRSHKTRFAFIDNWYT